MTNDTHVDVRVGARHIVQPQQMPGHVRTEWAPSQTHWRVYYASTAHAIEARRVLRELEAAAEREAV